MNQSRPSVWLARSTSSPLISGLGNQASGLRTGQGTRNKESGMSYVKTLTAAFAGMVLAVSTADAATCESLSSAKLTNGTVTSATSTAAGALAQSGGRGGAALADVPAFCRVAATLTPTKE